MACLDTPSLRCAIKRSCWCHEQRGRSPIEPPFPGSTPGGEAGPYLLTKFRHIHPGLPRTELRTSGTETILKPTTITGQMKVERPRSVMSSTNLLADARALCQASTKITPRATLRLLPGTALLWLFLGRPCPSASMEQRNAHFIGSPKRSIDSYGSIETTLNVALGIHLSILMNTFPLHP